MINFHYGINHQRIHFLSENITILTNQHGCYCNTVGLILIVGRTIQFMLCLWHLFDSANPSRERMQSLIFIMELITKEFIFYLRIHLLQSLALMTTCNKKECSHATVFVTLVDLI